MILREERNALLRENHYRWRKVHHGWVLIDPNGYETTQQQAEQAIQEKRRHPPVSVPSWARQMVKQQALVLDTESTGLHETAEIIELALITLDGTVLLNTLVQCQDPIPYDATRLHGITKAMLANGLAFPELWTQLIPYSDREIIIYNAGYDVPLLKETAARYNITFPRFHTHCLMIKYTDYISSGNKRDNYQRLDAACVNFHIPAGSHRALDDANAARQVLLRLAALK